MLGWADSEALRVAGYLTVAAIAVVVGVREQRQQSHRADLWPAFWFLTAGLFVVMAAGRVGNVDALLSDLGRQQAQEEGWYDSRRRLQATVLGGIGAVWFVAVVVTFWRIRERRRHHLPMAVLAATLGGYAGIRMISLHQVDSVLHNRRIEGARIGALTEVALLALALAAAVWQVVRVARTKSPPAGVAAAPSGR